MGYHMEQLDSNMQIKRRHHAKALKALAPLLEGRIAPRKRTSTERLQDALNWLGWDSEIGNGTGDIVWVRFEGEKDHDDEKIWALLAPFVQPGDHITLSGDDGAYWRWRFDGKAMTTLTGYLIFTDDRQPTVNISVRGGVAYLDSAPEGVLVNIADHDNARAGT